MSLQSDKRHKTASSKRSNEHFAILFSHQLKLLRVSRTHGDCHSSAFAELSKQRRRNTWSRSRNDDRIERRMFGQAQAAIANADRNIRVSKPPQNCFRRMRQARMPLDGVNTSRKLGQNGRLITRTGSDFEHSLASLQCERLQHESHDERLRNGLTLANRQRMVRVGLPPIFLGNEFMARNSTHRRENALVIEVSPAQLFLDHFLPLPRENFELSFLCHL